MEPWMLTIRVPSALRLGGHIGMGDSYQLLKETGLNSSNSCLLGGSCHAQFGYCMS